MPGNDVTMDQIERLNSLLIKIIHYYQCIIGELLSEGPDIDYVGAVIQSVNLVLKELREEFGISMTIN
jgi:hypothetical protein